MRGTFKLRTGVVLIIMAASVSAAGRAQTADDSELTATRAFADGVDAYIYGYPLVAIAMTERVATTTPSATFKIGRAPINQFAKATSLPDASYTDVVLPSTTTLYASAYLNLDALPIVLHIPRIKNRYFIFQMLDAWTNVQRNSPSTRLDSPEGDYLLVGPDFKGWLPPDGRQIIRFDTNTVWIICRVYTSGTPADIYEVANRIFPQITLTPLRSERDYTPPENLPVNPSIDTETQPIQQVANMDACAFFGTLSAMLTSNPPRLIDQPTVARLANIKIVPGKQFNCAALDDADHPNLRRTLQLAVIAGKAVLKNAGQPSLTPTNWSMALNVGDYGRRYLLRALVAEKAIGANRPEDAVYGYGTHDSGGTTDDHFLNGANQYVIHFRAPTSQRGPEEIPPVNAKGFWSVTMYKQDGTLVANNVVNYNAIGVPEVQAHKACFNSDGSLDMYIQANPPSSAQQFCNWLPAPPDENFIVFLRMYYPGSAITSGQWYPPGIQRVN